MNSALMITNEFFPNSFISLQTKGCGWRIVISPMIPYDCPPCYDSAMRHPAVLFVHPDLGPFARTWLHPFHSGEVTPYGPPSERNSLPTTLHEGAARHAHFPVLCKSFLFYCLEVVRPGGFELPAFWFVGKQSSIIYACAPRPPGPLPSKVSKAGAVLRRGPYRQLL